MRWFDFFKTEKPRGYLDRSRNLHEFTDEELRNVIYNNQSSTKDDLTFACSEIMRRWICEERKES